MKKYFFLMTILVLISGAVFAQGMGEHRRPGEKIEQLEKIKLIEALDMNEETTLKFFARRNEMRDRVDKLNDSLDVIVSTLETKFSNQDKSGYKELSGKFLSIQSQIAAQHSKFIGSLNDILTNEQIARLIVFQKRFPEEIRRILFRGRGRERPPDLR